MVKKAQQLEDATDFTDRIKGKFVKKEMTSGETEDDTYTQEDGSDHEVAVGPFIHDCETERLRFYSLMCARVLAQLRLWFDLRGVPGCGTSLLVVFVVVPCGSSFCIVSRRALVCESSYALCGLSRCAQFGVVVLQLLFEPSCSRVFGVIVLQ
ncbi:hypothetical protein Taro_037405, partial [Colocasia esculenta]|nr:hypothetical protein [Colocasia esculenta]